MQVTIEVLPAPLGPMIENSSPSFTPKLTSVSARTPPKRSDTPRTSKACSTHSLHPAHSAKVNSLLPIRIRVVCPGRFARSCLAIGEINPVHPDGSTCFSHISTSTVALVVGIDRP